MLMSNNYTDAFDEFAIKNGRDIFNVYQDSDTTDEERGWLSGYLI